MIYDAMRCTAMFCEKLFSSTLLQSPILSCCRLRSNSPFYSILSYLILSYIILSYLFLTQLILSCPFILHEGHACILQLSLLIRVEDDCSLLSDFHLHYLWHSLELLALVDIDTPLRVPLLPPHVVLSCQTSKQKEGRE